MKQIITILILLALMGCQKEFLEERPSKALVVPQTLQDFQALLDNTSIMNTGYAFPGYSDGDFTMSEAALSSSSHQERNAYLWRADIFEGSTNVDWDLPYQQIFYSNVVLEGLEEYVQASNEQEEYDQIKGSALFFRAMAYQELVQQFAVPYQAATAQQALGVPIKLGADVNLILPRASLQECYEQIIADLEAAIPLLRENIQPITRPNRTAANALLARVYLNMGDYANALSHANASLQSKSELLDYNGVVPVGSLTFPNPIVNPHPEILFLQRLNFGIGNNAAFSLVEDFYDSYSEHDLRKALFYDAERKFIGTYSGHALAFSGLATDEVYLIKAECEARLNSETTAALATLNTLLDHRYADGSDYEVSTNNADELLAVILEERRKELVTRTRWADLRRLNPDSRFAVTLTRTYQGQTYTLPPNSSRYVFAIPDDEISWSGIGQNVRNDND